jgi:hypothetical protein
VLITRVAPARFLDPDPAAGIVNLWAEVDNPADVRLIWLEVKAPNYDPVDPGPELQIEMETFKKATTEVVGTEYQWNAVGDTPDPSDLFDTPGTYQIFYFVKDDVTGHTSPLMQGRVYRRIDGNLKPEPFDLLYPSDCPAGCFEEQRTTLAFDWEDALNQDPETDTITYTVLLSKDDPGFTDPIYIEGIANSGCVLGPEHGIEDLSTYFWKVQAIDQYGAFRDSTTSRVFHTNNDNPLGFGWIEGHVYSAYDDTPIVGATILFDGTPIETSTGGYYIGILSPNAYAVIISATGFTSRTLSDVTVIGGDVVTREFWLAPDDQVPDPEFAPLPNTFTTITEVTLTCPNGSAEIRYTTDGSEPDELSTLYGGPLTITATTELRARAYLFGLTPSEVVSGVYTIDLVDGDLSGEGDVNLADAILGLQVLSGITPSNGVLLSGDVNNDAKISMEEVIYILQYIAGIR